ncbi:MAG: START domain-containing protein [Spirochaetes bacterium]|nr:START domain-containing protein [Spirochaetota bacterium]
MKKFLCAMLFLASTAFPAQDGSGDWRLLVEKKDIRIYANRVAGSPIDELKGECVLDAPLEVVAQVMLDVASYPGWVADCVEARKFGCSTATSCLLYFTLGMPWPVLDRDIVLQSSTEICLDQGTIIGRVTALSEKIVPEHKRRVRITSMYGTWIFKRLSPEKTDATFICWADPGGFIPTFIINIASRDIPYRTLRGLREMVKKEEYITASRNFNIETFEKDGEETSKNEK